MKRLWIGLLLPLVMACWEAPPETAAEPEQAPEAIAGESEPEVIDAPPPEIEPADLDPAPAAVSEPPAQPPAPSPVPATPPVAPPQPAPEHAPPAPPSPEPTPAVVPPPTEAPAPPGPSVEAPEPPAEEFEFETLEQRLRDTRALGLFTKLELKNQIGNLMDAVGHYHQNAVGNLQSLRERFDLLVLKVMSLLQKKEPELAGQIGRAKAALWAILENRERFAELEAR